MFPSENKVPSNSIGAKSAKFFNHCLGLTDLKIASNIYYYKSSFDQIIRLIQRIDAIITQKTKSPANNFSIPLVVSAIKPKIAQTVQ